MLFEKLIQENNIWDAHIVAKNMFNRNLGRTDDFLQFFNFALSVAAYPIESDTRRFFAKEAETAMTVFSENVEISDETLAVIVDARKRLFKIVQELSDIDTKKAEESLVERRKRNEASLKCFIEIKGKMFNTKKQSDFDSLLAQLAKVESSIAKDAFTDEQQALYDSLTKDFSQLVSNKMEELAHFSNVEYNKAALTNFQAAFNAFRDNESKYTGSESQLFTLVSRKLFSYDASRLFSETLIYYNHVYSYIFGKLNDDGKFRLTQYSIDAEKVRR
ncbi:hypothetical protein DEAC_c36560 [Desulfosporosinus acididurans]|uniref:Uncharacterized protein n=1 Tax=Desulfosporosinus acididurans TaxID=476652 RepID=A0A0J1FLQ3_9FIRM|nr:hypothetical protein [Desulfosporosinus acididurans]KLU64454.1 hypothetical protein DEAC_c36560 [Desulfosporosinus acididurans]